MVYIYYTNPYDEDKFFDFCQTTKDSFANIRTDTENALQKPTLIEVKGSAGLYVQHKDGSHFVFWDNGDYFIYIHTANEFSINELISICNSVQKIE